MNVRLRHNMTFSAGIYYGGQLQMNLYTLTLHMVTSTINPVNHNVAFERIKYFVYRELDNTIFINVAHQEQCQLYAAAGLNLTTMPEEPVDQLIGIMLYYKLNAIMEDRIVIEETEISSMLGENMVYLHCENENINNIDTATWWYTPDTVHSDFVSSDSENVVAMNSNNTWRDLDLAWPSEETPDATGNIVVFANFKDSNETK